MKAMENGSKRPACAVLAFPFRPFFLLTALYGVVLMTGWMGLWFFGWQPGQSIPPLRWHAHEMLFGLAPAAIAGFLLTAMCNWTGAKPLRGWPLGGLALIWVAGRVCMWLGTSLSPWLIVSVDAAFLLIVSAYAAVVIGRSDPHKNLLVVALPALLLIANLFSHAGIWTGSLEWTLHAETIALLLLVLLMAVIGGRIIPAFTANWLQRQGLSRERVRVRRWVDRASMAATVALLLLTPLPTAPVWPASLAILAGMLHAARLSGWAGVSGRGEPLIWVLHLGYAWIAAGLMLKGLAHWAHWLGPSVWVHAIGVGAMGTLLVGIMTRVSLGHTGRELVLPPGAASIYLAISIAAVLRMASAIGWLPGRGPLALAGLAWILAFGLFLLWFFPILTAPRADGRPG